jgi:hypothetical protein
MKKVTTLLIVVLMVLACFLFYKLAKHPKLTVALQNEISNVVMQNDFEVEFIKMNILQINESSSFHPAVLRAKAASTKANLFLDSVNIWFNEAINGRLDALDRHLQSSDNLFDTTILDQEEQLSFKSVKAELIEAQKITNSTLLNLAIENARYSTLIVLERYVELLGYHTDAAVVKFDTNFPQRPDTWKKGIISFNPPDVMELNNRYRLSVKISKELKADLLEKLPTTEKTMVDSLWVGDIMIVRLQGDDFTIKAYDDEEQGVLDAGYTQWEFDVTPNSTGKHYLYVKAGIVYHLKDLGATRKYFPVYEKEIEIEISMVRFITTFATERWEFLISSIVIPLLTLGYSRWRKRSSTSDTNIPR